MDNVFAGRHAEISALSDAIKTLLDEFLSDCDRASFSYIEMKTPNITIAKDGQSISVMKLTMPDGEEYESSFLHGENSSVQLEEDWV